MKNQLRTYRDIVAIHIIILVGELNHNSCAAVTCSRISNLRILPTFSSQLLTSRIHKNLRKMDFIALETQFEMQVMRNQALVDVVNCVRKDILLLEGDENKRLSSSSSSTKGVLDVKIGELRAGSIKCHEMQRELIDDAEKLRDFRARQVDALLGSQLEKCIGQEKAANKIR